jgi:hypothetical protein
MSNHYLDLFSYRMYVNSEYKQYEQFIFDSFLTMVLKFSTQNLELDPFVLPFQTLV